MTLNAWPNVDISVSFEKSVQVKNIIILTKENFVLMGFNILPNLPVSLQSASNVLCHGGIRPQFGQPTICLPLYYNVTIFAESRCLLALIYLLT